MLAGLPKALNAQHENIHLMSASNKVPVLQMVKPIVEDLLVLQEGIFMFDAYLQQNVLVVAPVLALMGDNPRASEIAGHLTGNPNKFCRQCMVNLYNIIHVNDYSKQPISPHLPILTYLYCQHFPFIVFPVINSRHDRMAWFGWSL